MLDISERELYFLVQRLFNIFVKKITVFIVIFYKEAVMSTFALVVLVLVVALFVSISLLPVLTSRDDDLPVMLRE